MGTGFAFMYGGICTSVSATDADSLHTALTSLVKLVFIFVHETPRLKTYNERNFWTRSFNEVG